jgi:hypothetical protein
MEVLQYCRSLLDGSDNYHFFQLFHDFLGEKFEKKPFERYELLSPAIKYKLIASNLTYEKKISKKYLGRSRLFLDPVPNPRGKWEPYSLTLEKALPIIIKLIDEDYRLLKKIQAEIDEIKEQMREKSNE